MQFYSWLVLQLASRSQLQGSLLNTSVKYFGSCCLLVCYKDQDLYCDALEASCCFVSLPMIFNEPVTEQCGITEVIHDADNPLSCNLLVQVIIFVRACNSENNNNADMVSSMLS